MSFTEKKSYKKGIVKTILLIVIALLALSYFGIDLEQVVQSKLFRKNVAYSWKTAKSAWTNYIYDPIFNKDKDSSSSTTIPETQ